MRPDELLRWNYRATKLALRPIPILKRQTFLSLRPLCVSSWVNLGVPGSYDVWHDDRTIDPGPSLPAVARSTSLVGVG